MMKFIDDFSVSICTLINKITDQRVIGLVTCTGIITTGAVICVDKVCKAGFECDSFKLGTNNKIEQ